MEKYKETYHVQSEIISMQITSSVVILRYKAIPTILDSKTVVVLQVEGIVLLMSIAYFNLHVPTGEYQISNSFYKFL